MKTLIHSTEIVSPAAESGERMAETFRASLSYSESTCSAESGEKKEPTHLPPHDGRGESFLRLGAAIKMDDEANPKSNKMHEYQLISFALQIEVGPLLPRHTSGSRCRARYACASAPQRRRKRNKLHFLAVALLHRTWQILHDRPEVLFIGVA